jgi:ABC-type uncharacterized transport system permease subunit
VLFLGLELLSITLYVLAGFAYPRLSSEEAAMKYLLVGAFAAGFLVFGIALTYGASGSSNLNAINTFLTQQAGGASDVSLLLVGAALVVVGLVRLGRPVGAVAVVAFVVALVLGAVAFYCVWLLLTVTAFWIVRVDVLVELFDGLYQAGRWPVTVYPGWLRIGFTFLVPLAFAITVPASALTGRLSAWLLVGTAAFTATLAAGTRWVWRRGLRRYSGASA